MPEKENAVPILDAPTVPVGLALELDMLKSTAHSGRAFAFLWRSTSKWLVVPERFGRTALYPSASVASTDRGWPVTTRKTGGGITPQGPGVLNVALAFTTAPGKSRTMKDSYAAICDPLIEALGAMQVIACATPVKGSFCDGDYNLAVAGRKTVGTAQRWRGNTCLCHAMILTDIALAPAVDAVARFSHDLGHDTTFDASAHTRLADLIEDASDLEARVAATIWQSMTHRGYSAFTPTLPQI